MNFKKWLLKEIQSNPSLINSNIDYNQFVDWAKSEADKISKNREKFSKFEFQWAESTNDVKIIAYENNFPIGYVALEKFEDGYKISTLGVKPAARGKGLASTIYDYILTKTKLYSDKMQTPEAKKLWLKLYNKYKVLGFNQTLKTTFPVIPQNNELTSADPKFILYSNKENDNFLVISPSK
jgi:ribosomal protein S18 acetylase RimI-like enzyme